MSQLVINIAYLSDNQETVTELVRQLEASNAHFNLIDANGFAFGEDFQEHLLVAGEPCLLMISDNFLKSNACLRNGLNYLQKLIKNEQVIPLIIDGISIDSQGNRVKSPTEFEKVSNVIKYMNHWQEKYLELRKLKRTIPEEEEEAFVKKLKVVRSISSEVGEFLRNLRDTNYYSLEEFSANNFEAFFRNFGDEVAYLKFVSTNSTIQDDPIKDIEELASQEDSPVSYLPLENLIEDKKRFEEIEKLEETSSSVESEEVPKIIDESTIETKIVREDLSTFIESDPEWAAVSEEDTVGEVANIPVIEEGKPALTDTELLALELANKLPNSNNLPPEIEGYNEEEEEEEEEILSLEDLMGTDFGDSTSNSIFVEEELAQDEKTIGGDPLTEDNDGIAKPSMDLFSELEKSDGSVIKELNTLEEDVEIDSAEAELEGYFMDEGEELDEIEIELNELDVLESVNTLVQSGKISEGISYLEETLEEAPEFVSVRYQYAAFLAKYQNNFKEASNQLAILLDQEPNNLSAKFFLGELAEAERDYLTAKSYYQKVYEENPDFPNAAYKLGMLLVNHLDEASQEAASFLKQAYNQDQENITALYQLAVLQGETLGEEEKAIQSFQTILEKAPEHPFANYDLAIIYHNRGAEDEALGYYQKAITVNPELKTLVNDQAFAMSQKEVEKTIQELEADAKLDKSTSSSTNTIDTKSSDLEEIKIAENSINSNIEAIDSDVGTLPNEVFEFPFSEAKTANLELIPNKTSVEEEKKPPKSETTKVALITGATSGIGRATAQKFAEEGYQLILTGRRFSRLFQLKDQFEKNYNSTVRLLPFDIKDPNAVQSALAELDGNWQEIDILVNNAGLAKGETAIHEGEFEHWDSMIDTNVKGLLYVTREVAPFMVKRQTGQIINVCSLAGKEVYPNNAVYCATKHAVDALTKAMRIDLHKYNIRVSQISPGFVADTEFSMIKHEQSEPSILDFTPVNAQDVADVIFFMTTQPNHVNLQEIVLTGTQQATANIIAREH